MKMFEMTFSNGDVVLTPEDFLAEWRWEYAGNGHAVWSIKELDK